MASVSSSLSASSGCFRVIVVLPLLILFVARVDAVSVFNGPTVSRSHEVTALINFKKENTNGSSTSGRRRWRSWHDTHPHPCGSSWPGVICSDNDQTVEKLDFSGWGLRIRSLEPLYNLTHLRLLDLSSNHVDLDDGFGICNFVGLTHLDLSSTGVDGELAALRPSTISACRSLRVLALENNGLDTLLNGTRELANLQFLTLANNSLSGPFPTEELGSLSSLVSLDLSSNSLSGNIPSLPNLTSLFELNLENNKFTGFDEPWIVGTASLGELYVSDNQLQGTIPSTIASLTNLRTLRMSRNNLSGHIPPGFSHLISYNHSSLDLSQNQLTGEIPTDTLAQSDPSVVYASVNLSYNLLSGNVPIDGSKVFSLLFLDLSYNNLSGSIPMNTFNHDNSAFLSLRLNNNHLSGDIVDTFFLGPGILGASEVRLENNLFTGDLSRMVNSSLSLTDSLIVLDISNNNLRWSTSEVIPDPIAAMLEVLTSAATNLQEFTAGGNNFSGTPLPAKCFVNHPSEVFLSVLDLSNSHLQGEILGAAFNSTCLPYIQLLNLSNNHATGPLLESIIADHVQDFIIDVTNNNLSGPLPIIPRRKDLDNPRYFKGDKRCGDPFPSCDRGTGAQWRGRLITIGAYMTIATGICLARAWRRRVYGKQRVSINSSGMRGRAIRSQTKYA